MKYHKREPPVEKTCVICGKGFTVKACDARQKPHECCSTACALVQRRKGKTSFSCCICGTTIALSPWKIKKVKHGPFCSTACYGKWRSMELTGEKAPNWKGGKDAKYGHREWKRSRELAKRRDKNRCQKCGQTFGDRLFMLDVHHIKPVDMFDDPKMANDLSNLVTVCKKCHAGIHGRNSGKGAFTYVAT